MKRLYFAKALQFMDFTSAKTYILERLRTELSEKLTYHSYQHTLDVLRAVREIADAEKVFGESRHLLETAAAFHDAGFLQSFQEHEQAGCVIARKQLPRFGYSNKQIERICEMIIATRIPQSPTSDLARILCDADLYYLGQDDFYSTGRTLFHEFRERGIVNNEEEWNRLQLRFLESHQYFTQTAIERRSNRKAQHLAEVRAIVDSYAA